MAPRYRRAGAEGRCRGRRPVSHEAHAAGTRHPADEPAGGRAASAVPVAVACDRARGEHQGLRDDRGAVGGLARRAARGRRWTPCPCSRGRRRTAGRRSEAGSRSMRLTAPQPMVRTTSRTGAPRRCLAASAATRVTTTESMRSSRTASVEAVAYGVVRGLVGGVLVGVADDEPGGREREHGDVAAQLVVVEGRLVVHDVGDHGLVGQGGVERVADQLGVVAAALDVGAQARGRGCPSCRWSCGHPPTPATPTAAAELRARPPPAVMQPAQRGAGSAAATRRADRRAASAQAMPQPLPIIDAGDDRARARPTRSRPGRRRRCSARAGAAARRR